jgi:DNA repair protein RadC
MSSFSSLVQADTERRHLSPLERRLVDAAIACLEGKYQIPECPLVSPALVRDYLNLRLKGIEYEVFAVVLLNNRHVPIRYVELFRGTIDGASVHPREVVKEVLGANAAAVIFAHNHPSGTTEPSMADQRITQRLKDALALVDVRVLDHLIVGSGEAVSFAERGLL